MHFHRLIILVTIGLTLFACAATEEVSPVTSTAAPATLTVAQISPTETSLPTQTPRPTATVATSTPTVTVTPKPGFELCSPLGEQTLQEIQEIISGPYDPPPDGSDARHHGVDFSYYRRKDRNTIEGEVVQAVLSGEVILVSGDQLPYGNLVILETKYAALPEELALNLGIRPNESLYHLYAHLRTEPLVVNGEWVECGQPLGEVGKTGYNIVNPHLHIETRIGPADAAFDEGMRYYDTSAIAIEQENYELWRTSGVYRHFDPMDLINTYLENRAGE